MDDILLYLCLTYDGQWMDIYDSLQKREQLDSNTVLKTNALVPKNVGYVTLIDKKYPENLKSIYKPPFGIFYNGSFDLIEADKAKFDSKTLFGDFKQALEYSLTIPEQKLIWSNLSLNQLKQVLDKRAINNVFFYDEMVKAPEIQVPAGNVIISEIYKKNAEKDYSNQNPLRLSAGISKSIVMMPKTSIKAAKAVENYTKMENINIEDNRVKKTKK